MDPATREERVTGDGLASGCLVRVVPVPVVFDRGVPQSHTKKAKIEHGTIAPSYGFDIDPGALAPRGSKRRTVAY